MALLFIAANPTVSEKKAPSHPNKICLRRAVTSGDPAIPPTNLRRFISAIEATVVRNKDGRSQGFREIHRLAANLSLANLGDWTLRSLSPSGGRTVVVVY